jgi:hypothetical protein
MVTEQAVGGVTFFFSVISGYTNKLFSPSAGQTRRVSRLCRWPETPSPEFAMHVNRGCFTGCMLSGEAGLYHHA